MELKPHYLSTCRDGSLLLNEDKIRIKKPPDTLRVGGLGVKLVQLVNEVVRTEEVTEHLHCSCTV